MVEHDDVINTLNLVSAIMTENHQLKEKIKELEEENKELKDMLSAAQGQASEFYHEAHG